MVTVAARRAGTDRRDRRTTSRVGPGTGQLGEAAVPRVVARRELLELVEHRGPARVTLAEVGVDAAQAGVRPGSTNGPTRTDRGSTVTNTWGTSSRTRASETCRRGSPRETTTRTAAGPGEARTRRPL